MKHHIQGIDKSPGDDSMMVETCGRIIELWTYGPRGGYRGFIVLDRDEFRNLLQDLLKDESLTRKEAI